MVRRRIDEFGDPLPGANEVDLWGHGPLGFQNRNRQRGRSAELGGINPKTGEDNPLEATLLQSGGQGTVGDSMAGLTAITLGYEDGNPDNATTPQYVRAKIEWGTDGVQHTAFCDFIRGTVVHVAGSFFRVSAEVIGREQETGGAGPVIPADSTAIVQASIGYWGGGNCRPQLTLQATAEDFGEGVVGRFRVPRFACEWTVVMSGNPIAVWKIAEGLGGILGTENFGAVNRMPIPGIAPFVEVGGEPPGGVITTVWYLSI